MKLICANIKILIAIMENSESLVTICKPLCDKMDLLKTNIEFLKSINNNKPEGLKIIQKMDSTVMMMLNDMTELQELLEEQRALHSEMKVEEVEISHLLYKVDVLHNTKNGNQDFENNSCHLMNGSDQMESIPQIVRTSSCVDLSPIQVNNASSSIVRQNMKPRHLAFDIVYVTDEEYKLLPKYLVGRLTLEAINKFVDVVNDAFSKKYNILSKSMSTLKNQELYLFKKYKQQENVKVKGKHFIIEGDIAREFNKPTLEKKAYNFLTILRHTGRLLRDQIDGVVIYGSK